MKNIKKENGVQEAEVVKSTSFKNFLPWLPLVLVLIAAGGAYLKWGNVATVNGQPISRIEYYRNLEQQDNKQTLEQMIEESLIGSEAEKNGITIDQGVIDEEMKSIDERLSAQGQTLDKALEAQGMTRSELERQIRLQKTIEQLAKPKTEFGQEEIDGFLATNKDQLPTGVSKDDLQNLAKDELAKQELNRAIGEWFTKVKAEAKIVYN